MKDPYQVLGVSRSASLEEIKVAYRNLAKKYHPDNYDKSPLADLAAEKMKEINEAYDLITNNFKNKNNNKYNSDEYYGNYYNSSSGNSNFADVRQLIYNNRISDAEQILDGVPENSKTAEWYFLKGTVYYKRGWFDEAFVHFDRANRMEPENREYSAAINRMLNQRNRGGNVFNNSQSDLCTFCSCMNNLCNTLICLDCLCGGSGNCC